MADTTTIAPPISRTRPAYTGNVTTTRIGSCWSGLTADTSDVTTQANASTLINTVRNILVSP